MLLAIATLASPAAAQFRLVIQDKDEKSSSAKQENETPKEAEKAAEDQAAGKLEDKADEKVAPDKAESEDKSEKSDAEDSKEPAAEGEEPRVASSQGSMAYQPSDSTGFGTSLQASIESLRSLNVNPSAGTGANQADVSSPQLSGGTASANFIESTTLSESKYISALDIGSLLEESSGTNSVTIQRRSSTSQNPYVRGYRNGQIYTQADGAKYLPVRPDLDSLIGKIDPGLIKDIIVVPGPYGVRYGQGFSFLDISLIDAPRYDNREHHLLSGLNVRTNGGQVALRETAYGGGKRSGYVASFTGRIGSDYSPGGSTIYDGLIPSSYKSTNGFLKYSHDLTPESRVEFQYGRYDEYNTEYAGQFFDVNHLSTDAFSTSYIVEDPYEHVTKVATGWFNYTGLSGDTQSGLKRSPFPVIDRVERALATAPPGFPSVDFEAAAEGHLANSGFRLRRTKGDKGDARFTFGADFTYIEHVLRERFSATSPNNVPINQRVVVFPASQTNMPGAKMVNPGLFVEYEKPWGCLPGLTTNLGGRADYAFTDANASQLRTNTSLLNTDQLDQNDVLWAAYFVNSYQVNDALRLSASAGHSERVPDLIDRYADGIFMGIMQSGFSRVIGSPTLDKEKLWQVDTGFDLTYGSSRGSAKYFYSWIQDYNLYQGALVLDPSGARLLRATNADLVTLTGFELDGAHDVSPMFTLFGYSRYLVGDDRNIQLQNGSQVDQPLYGISPLEGTTGIRFHDRCNGERWGCELGLRMVAKQNRLAGLRLGSTNVVGIGPLESATPGFTLANFRSYYNYSEKVHFTGGIENLFDRKYFEHLDLRLPAANGFIASNVLSPGFTPYFGLEIVR